MKKVFPVHPLLALALAGSVLAGAASSAFARDANREPKIMEFDTMVGLPPALTGTQNPIRGVNGGGLPWAIGSAKGELTRSGYLEVKVEGLVFSAGPNTGRNTIPSFRAIVSCLTSDGSVVNTITGAFPATLGAATEGGGNASIQENLTLPQPCIAPIIFVTSPGGAWFSVTGGSAAQ